MENLKGKGSPQSSIQSLHQDESTIMPGHLDKYTLPHFHLACLKERVSVVKELIDAGADLNEAIAWDAPHCHQYTPLQCAIESPYDRREKVQLLLQRGAVVKQIKCICNRKHMTALHLAFYNEYRMSSKDSDPTIVDILYKATESKEENIKDENELGYLHIAVSRNDFATVEMYLDKGAKINHSVLHNNHGFFGYTPLHIAVKYELVDMANFLINCGAKVDVGQGRECQPPLFTAVQTGNLKMIKLLNQCGAKIRNCLLHHAVASGNPEVVQYLVDSGCDVNVRDDHGQTPIITSLKADSPSKKIIEILLEAGVSVKLEDNFGNSALIMLDTRAFLSEDVAKFEIYKVFLEKACETEGMRFTGLWLLTFGNEKDINMLLQTNVDLFVRDNYGNTLIHALAINLNPGVIEQLRGRRFDINAREWFDNTPLMIAAHRGNFIAVQTLLDLGADIEALNEDGETVLYTSLRVNFHGGGKECILVLLEHGANVQVETFSLFPTIFDVLADREKYLQRELVLAHLALQELSGTVITERIQRKIESHDQFKNYFEYCKRLLSLEIYPLVTVFDVLSASQRKLERHLRNEELASKLKDFQTIDYFHTLLAKRLSKAMKMIELRDAVKPIISKLMNADYNRIPSIVDDILSYFVKEDIEYLISIDNQIQMDSDNV